MKELLDSFSGFSALPPHGVGALLVLLLYAVQAEIRFGARARSMSAGASDRGTSLVVSLSSAVPILGFVLAMKGLSPMPGSMPGMPAIAWVGVGLGGLGLLLRLWAVLTLRERYTRTLLVHDQHQVERGGPYRFIRHPGYLGSLLCLNGIALASADASVFVASAAATLVAYAYRISVEDAMLVDAFGPSYENYRREVAALVPFVR
jgi:protein-S-isoprenylcysteine O-methyltransferase Ste14